MTQQISDDFIARIWDRILFELFGWRIARPRAVPVYVRQSMRSTNLRPTEWRW